MAMLIPIINPIVIPFFEYLKDLSCLLENQAIIGHLLTDAGFSWSY